MIDEPNSPPEPMPPGPLETMLLSDPERRAALVGALALIVDEEVKRARGFKAGVLRSAYRTVRRMRPGMVPHIVSSLLDGWIHCLEPYYQLHLAGARHETFAEYVTARRDAVAEQLMAVAGERAERSSNKMARAFFRSLSQSAQQDLARAVPRIGALVEGYLAA